MQSFPFFDILLLAMVAGFIAFRLYSVLGRRTGHERSPEDRVGLSKPASSKPASSGKVIPLPERKGEKSTRVSAEAPSPPALSQPTLAEPVLSEPLQRALMDVKLADRRFDTAQFLEGARAAHEMIATAYAKGDRETLRPLLSDEVFGAFEQGIVGREEHKERVEFAYLALRNAKITGAGIKDRMAEITITFESEFILAGYDPEGKLVEGDPKVPHSVTDIWTFARDLRSRDPNWTLVATASGG
jgi:predicted lipid-binding transport protein (Tim44 family)